MPNVEAFYFESKSKGSVKGKRPLQWKKEIKNMVHKSKSILLEDPIYNKNLSLIDLCFSISFKNNSILKLSSSYRI